MADRATTAPSVATQPTVSSPAVTATPGPPPPSRLNHGELVSGAGAVLLLVFMFAFAWYGVDGIPGRTSVGSGISSAVDAWNGLSALRWLMLLTAAVAIASVAIHAWRTDRATIATVRLAVVLLGTLTAALLVYRVLIDLPSSDRVFDQKLGAILGLLSALAIAVGGYEAVREQRARTIALARWSRSRDRVAAPPTPR